MSQNYQQGGGRAPRKPIINKWEGEGIVCTRSGNENDEIKFFPFKDGGGAIHISVACTEVNGADANGQPRTTTSYVPVDIMTNKLITQQQLMGVRPGMKVHVVGKLVRQTYDSKRTGNKVSTMIVNAYVFEILEMPQQAYAQPGMPQQGPYPQPYPQQGGYQQPYPGQPGYQQPPYPQQGPYVQQGGYQPQQYQQPQYGQGVGQQYQQPYPGQPGYQQPAPQAAPAPAPPMPAQQAQQQRPAQPQVHGPVPPYYQPPQGYAGPPVQQGGAPVDDDLPPGDPINV